MFVLAQLPAPARRRLLEMWCWRAHGGQAEPAEADAGGPWRVWMVMAGRGFGKTRAGAEWVWARTREMALAGPEDGGGGAAKIALVGGTIDEVRDVMVEGESGIVRAARTGEWARWSATRRCVEFSNGAVAFAYSGERPEKLRGPEHHFAWCDELAKWGRAEDCWDNLQMTLRLGARPRIMVTTTPRAVPAVRRVLALPDLAKTDGTSWENVHLPRAQLDAVTALWEGTRMGRQELSGELIDDVERALFPRGLLERARAAAPVPIERMKRIVVGVDPPGSADGDACGIVVCGLGADGVGYVLADCSEGGLSPEGWARKVAAAAAAWDAGRVVAEKNMGGEMVESVLRAAEAALPLRLVHAVQGKGARAAPVAALFEGGRAKLAGAFPALEDELAGLVEGGGYEGPGRSPDRADAMVWAMRELMLGTPARVPQVRRL
ncbi:MAG TPA: terminase family protein [Allosphingosinicella sp.]